MARHYNRAEEAIRERGRYPRKSEAMIERRDLLDPRNLAEPEESPVLLRFARRAMATTFEVVVPYAAQAVQAAAEQALDEVDRVESLLTVYREDSEVSRINAEAAERPIALDVELFELLQRCRRWYDATRGAFDVAAGALVKAWGFFRRQGQVPEENDRRLALSRSGMRLVRLDPEAKTIRFLQRGVELNFGAVGKGHAVDRAAEALRRSESAWLVHGGRSSVYAAGDEPGSSRGWSVGITDPERPDRRLAVVRLKNRGLGISAATFQHFEHEGRKLGHLLDPRKGWPAEGMATVAVTAPSAAEADALATAFFVLGEAFARGYCDAHPDLGALLLSEGTKEPVFLGRMRQEAVPSQS